MVMKKRAIKHNEDTETIISRLWISNNYGFMRDNTDYSFDIFTTPYEKWFYDATLRFSFYLRIKIKILIREEKFREMIDA